MSTSPVTPVGHPSVPPAPPPAPTPATGAAASTATQVDRAPAADGSRPTAEIGQLFVGASAIGVDAVHRSYIDGLLRAHLVAIWVARCWPAPPPPEVVAPPAVRPVAATSTDVPGRPPGRPLHDGLVSASELLRRRAAG